MTVYMEKTQADYALYLPAISGAYLYPLGRDKVNPGYIPASRVPAGITNGVQSLDFLNHKDGLFNYPWGLYSAGHANLDPNKESAREDTFRNRDRSHSFILGDSGGFQIGKGVWTGNWTDPECPQALKRRETVLEWMETYMDYGMILDIPSWIRYHTEAANLTNIHTYQDAANATKINIEHWMKHRKGNCKFLNVLQGETHLEAEDWYQQVKDYCDPKKYPDNHLNGWSMGGQNMCDIHLALKRVVNLAYDDMLQEGVHDWMHFLGTSRLEWAVILTAIQRAVRKHHNANFTISFDSASPFLATANGKIYTTHRIDHDSKWALFIEDMLDDKKFATDTRPLGDVMRAEGFEWLDGPVSDVLKIQDVCYYKPGDLNKLGKEGRTSWDSFSYSIQMSHNIWSHVNAVQKANEAFDAGQYPSMLFEEKFASTYYDEVVQEVFAAGSRDKALKMIDDYEWFWNGVKGSRGNSGKKTYNGHAAFNQMFTVEHAPEEPDELDDDALEKLEVAAENG